MNSIVSFLDGFSMALVIVLWSYTILNLKKLPEIIPIHFDLEGKPDNYGAKYFIFFLKVFSLQIRVSFSSRFRPKLTSIKNFILSILS